MALTQCPKCGKQIPSDAAYCPQCGAPQPPKSSEPPAAPAEPKEDVSSQFPLTLIAVGDATEAIRQIIRHLNQLRAKGWKTGQAAFQNDSTCRYEIENATQKAVVRFNLLPTVKHLRGEEALMSLVVGTMSAAKPDFDEAKLAQMKTPSPTKTPSAPASKTGCLVFLIALPFGALAIAASFIAALRHLSQ
jgi:zinc-ribbon domain